MGWIEAEWHLAEDVLVALAVNFGLRVTGQ